MTPEFYLNRDGELKIERRYGPRRHSDIKVRRYFKLLGAVILALVVINLLQAARHAKMRAEIAAKVEHRVDLSQRDEEIGSVYDPETRWQCRAMPAVRM